MPQPHPPSESFRVSLFHNVSLDPNKWHRGYAPGDPLVRVFVFDQPAGELDALLERAFVIGNGQAPDPPGSALSDTYHSRGLRSLSVGDVVAVAEIAMSCQSTGWEPVTGELTISSQRSHGTMPWPSRFPGEPVPDGISAVLLSAVDRE